MSFWPSLRFLDGDEREEKDHVRRGDNDRPPSDNNDNSDSKAGVDPHVDATKHGCPTNWPADAYESKTANDDNREDDARMTMGGGDGPKA